MAVKVLWNQKKELQKSFLREAQLLKRCRSPYVVLLMGVVIRKEGDPFLWDQKGVDQEFVAEGDSYCMMMVCSNSKPLGLGFLGFRGLGGLG